MSDGKGGDALLKSPKDAAEVIRGYNRRLFYGKSIAIAMIALGYALYVLAARHAKAKLQASATTSDKSMKLATKVVDLAVPITAAVMSLLPVFALMKTSHVPLSSGVPGTMYRAKLTFILSTLAVTMLSLYGPIIALELRASSPTLARQLEGKVNDDLMFVIGAMLVANSLFLVFNVIALRKIILSLIVKTTFLGAGVAVSLLSNPKLLLGVLAASSVAFGAGYGSSELVNAVRRARKE